MLAKRIGLVGVGLMTMALGACGDDDGETDTTSVCGDTSIDESMCSVVLQPSADDSKSVQTALIEAKSGSTVCMCPGDYSFTKELSLTVPDVTIKGLGSDRNKVVLDFAAQTDGDDGLTVTSDGFTIEGLSVKNSPGNGIVVTGAEDVTFRDIKVSWDAGSVVTNGAYAVYPVKSTRVLVENTEIVGAADAGIYVGQCNQAIVRNNLVYGNVAGIEIENTLDADVHDNEAYDNSAGVLVFVLPNLEQKKGERALVHHNKIYDNNRANFAADGTIVAEVPTGVGVLLLGADETEIRDNEITGNVSTAFMAVSYQTLGVLLGSSDPDPDTDEYLEKTYIYNNTLMNNGTDPKDATALLGISPLQDVVWDGVVNMDNMAGAELCLGDMPPSFLNFGGLAGISDPMLHSTDSSSHECTLTPLKPVSW